MLCGNAGLGQITLFMKRHVLCGKAGSGEIILFWKRRVLFGEGTCFR